MSMLVICQNCGMKWLRVTAFSKVPEDTEDLQYDCPKCGSNLWLISEDSMS